MLTCSIYKALPQLVRDQWFLQTTQEIFEAATDNMDVIDVSLTKTSDRIQRSHMNIRVSRPCDVCICNVYMLPTEITLHTSDK